MKLNMQDIINQGVEVSDGYHTFTELYEHRITIFIALCKRIAEDCKRGEHSVWKSKLHSDGSSYEGWFILGIDTEKGKQITYHLPMNKWAECEWPGIDVYEKAPEWDGHTSEDVLKRLVDL